jgi:hypothetical protein
VHDTTGRRDLLETCSGPKQEQLGLGGVQLETSRSAPITDVDEAIAEGGEDDGNARRKTMRLSLNVISEEVIMEAMVLEEMSDVLGIFNEPLRAQDRALWNSTYQWHGG